MEDPKDYINRIFYLAASAGIVRQKQEFAEALEVDRSGLSAAMNGNPKYLTNSLINKVRKFAVANGLEENAAPIKPAPAAPQGAGFWVSEEFRKTMENMSETIRIQAQIISDLQGSTKVDGYVINPKKKTFIADGDK